MTVLTISAIIAALVVPGIISGLPARKLKAAAREIYFQCQRQRMKAVSQNQPHRVKFDLDSETFYLERCTDNDPTDPNYCQADEAWVNGDQEPKTLSPVVGLESANGESTGIVSQAFSPNGTAEVGQIVLNNSRGERYRITISQVGRVRVEKI